MKYLKYISILLLLISCKSVSQVDKLSHVTQNQKDVNSLSHLYPFNLLVDQMKVDSLNEFGAGDCWGNIQSLSLQKYSIVIDTTNCGNYGFYLNFYLLENGSFRIAHQIEVNNSTIDNKQVLTEDIYDYRSKPFKHLQRIDTASYSISSHSMNKSFQNMPIDDYQRSYEHLIMGMEGPWKMTIDY